MIEYVFDTSALIAWLDREEGFKEVRALLDEVADENMKGYCSVVSLIEVFYVALQEMGEAIANDRMQLLNATGMEFCPVSVENIYGIGKLKANHKMSFADCCVAALAVEKNSILVHKDPEFEQIEKEVKQLKLPYKKNTKKNV